jgi:hypothetical protein
MKKLLILFLFLSLNLSAQEITKTVATVKTVISEQAILQSRNIYISYQVPNGDFILGKEYVFWLEVTECEDCPNRIANVLYFTVTTNQAQRDMEKISDKLKQGR